MRLLKLLLRGSLKRLLLAALLGSVGGIASDMVIVLIQRAVAGAGLSAAPAFAAAAVLVLACSLLSQLILIRLAQASILGVRNRVVDGCLVASLPTIESLGSERILTCLTSDAAVVSAAVIALPLAVMNVAVVAGGLVYMGTLSAPLLLVTAGFLTVGIVGYRLAMSRAGRMINTARTLEERLFQQYVALAGGVKELALARTRAQAFRSNLSDVSNQWRIVATRGSTWYAAAGSWGQLLFLALLGGVAFVGWTAVHASVATLTGFALAILFVNTPLATVLNTLPVLARADVALTRIQSLDAGLAGHQARSSIIPARPSSAETLSLQAVEFAYPSDDATTGFQIGPVSGEFRAGTVTIISGGNGSGKTTLAKLLVGLYPPTAGRILLEGQAVDADDQRALRDRSTAVFADAYVFDRLLGLDVSDPAWRTKVESALRDLRLNGKLTIDDAGVLSTTKLSAGQRKRLALLQATVAADQPIVVLDEWAAEQDRESRDWFYHSYLAQLRDMRKIVIVISHDERYFSVADQILRLEYGAQVTFESEPPVHVHTDLTSPAAIGFNSL